MTWKRALQRQIYRLQQIAMPASLAMLALNLTLVAYPYIAWRGASPYMGTALIFLAIATLLIVAANVYVVVLKMHVAQRRAVLDHDPVQIYAFQPFQAVMVLSHAIPTMRAIARSTGDEDLAKGADRLEQWARQGWIPREEYPAELREYYPRQGGRL